MKALATALMVTATLVGMSAAHADGKTREQVQQELQAARAAGQVTFGELDYPPPRPSRPACRATRCSRSCKLPSRRPGDFRRTGLPAQGRRVAIGRQDPRTGPPGTGRGQGARRLLLRRTRLPAPRPLSIRARRPKRPLLTPRGFFYPSRAGSVAFTHQKLVAAGDNAC